MTVATVLRMVLQVQTSYAGFDQFCNLRAVYERPNSTFLDQAIRYASSDPASKLKALKQLEFGTRLTAETVGCYLKSSALVLFIGLSLWLAVKYRLVAFPFLGIGN